MKEQKDRQTRMAKWERTKRFWYNFYLFVGIGVNFLIYFTKPYGFDPSNNVPLGATVGLGIPLLVMVVGVFIHKKITKI